MTQNNRVSYDDLLVADDQSMLWNGKPFTGVAYETDASGQVISEATFVDGVKQGIEREWSGSGRLLSESNNHKGSKHGISKSWYENGQPRSEADFRFSIKTREKTWGAGGEPLGEWSMPKDDPQWTLIDKLAENYGRDR